MRKGYKLRKPEISQIGSGSSSACCDPTESSHCVSTIASRPLRDISLLISGFSESSNPVTGRAIDVGVSICDNGDVYREKAHMPDQQEEQEEDLIVKFVKIPNSSSLYLSIKSCIKLSHRKRNQNFIDPQRRRRNLEVRFDTIKCIALFILPIIACLLNVCIVAASANNEQSFDTLASSSSPPVAEASQSSESSADPFQTATTNAACFGGLQTFEKISMSSFESPNSSPANSFGTGILVQQDDQALTSECVNLCRSQSNCLSFVIDYNKFECKSYATTQQELQQELDARLSRSGGVGANNEPSNVTDGSSNGYQASASNINLRHLLPSASSNYFEKICLDGVANRNQFSDVCGPNRLWTMERVMDSFLDGYVEKEVTNVNNKDECSKLCIFETQFVCRSADYDQHSRVCRLSKEDRRTQPQAMRTVPGSNRQYLENQCATPGPSSCVYETKRNLGVISMDSLKFAQTPQDCQMKCNQETTFNCRSYSFHQQRCFLSGDDSVSLNSNLIKLPTKQGWLFGEKKCLVELCTKGIFTYEKITGYTLRSALSTSIDLMMPTASALSPNHLVTNYRTSDSLDADSTSTDQVQVKSRLMSRRSSLPLYHQQQFMGINNSASIVSAMMSSAINNHLHDDAIDPIATSSAVNQGRYMRSASNLAITENCRHSCDLGYLNCPAFSVDYKNNRCQRLDRNSQGRHNELVPRDGFAYYEKICLRVPEIMSMCQDKYWIFERVIGYELAPRLYEKSLKFVQSRRDCEEYCLEEKQFQCRSALYNDETSDCKLSRYDRRLADQEGRYYRNFNARISYLENQCIRDHGTESKQCTYEKARDTSAYPTFTERIELAPTQSSNADPSATNTHDRSQMSGNSSQISQSRHGSAYCEQLCNDNARFECHSFGYYSSTAQCFLSGDDTISAGEMAATPGTGFTYYERKCKMMSKDNEDASGNGYGSNISNDINMPTTSPPIAPSSPMNPYLRPPTTTPTYPGSTLDAPRNPNYETMRPYLGSVDNTSINIKIDQHIHNADRVPSTKPTMLDDSSAPVDPNHYKCGAGHTFVYQRISGFEPIGGLLTLLVKNSNQPGIVAECSELCRRAYECRAFVVDYSSNQCFGMLENSSVGLLSLRQTLGKDYFEGFCLADHLLLAGSQCKQKTWVIDKIVDQAVVGVQHQKLIPYSDRIQCRLACMEERLFWCKSAMFDGATGDCKLYSIDRESTPQMRLLFTKGVDFFENQCQIVSNTCPYDAIERDMTIVTATKSVQARSTFDCENACNTETSFNCRSYTYLDQYPSLPNLCVLSSDSRSTSQRGSVRENSRTLYAERNCYYRRPRFPGFSDQRPTIEPLIAPPKPPSEPSAPMPLGDPYSMGANIKPLDVNPPGKISSPEVIDVPPLDIGDIGPAIGQGCEPHQYTFERTFGYDFKVAVKERAPIPPTVAISIGCQQECLRRGDKCQSFVVEYALPYQSCFLIESQVGANKRLLVKSPNAAYFEKICTPRTGIDGIENPSPSPSAPMLLGGGSGYSSNHLDSTQQLGDINPSYSNEPWTPQTAASYYSQQQQLLQNYPSRSCAKLWYFERYINHNFTAPVDRQIDGIQSRVQCESYCLNEARFHCRAATYDYAYKICRLFKNTRRTILSKFVDLESTQPQGIISTQSGNVGNENSHPGTAQVLPNSSETEIIHLAASNTHEGSSANVKQRVSTGRQVSRQLTTNSIVGEPTAEPSSMSRNIDYLENTCVPEPSSCQYKQLYDVFSLYIDKINHAVSMSDCQRQCDRERLFTCKSINYEPNTRSCMLINEDLTSLNRGSQQASLLPKKNSIYSEKGSCEMISVQCNSQEMLVSINFDAPFRGRVMAKGNPEQCYLLGDGQTSLQFPIVFGPKCNSRQEGHNTFVNEVVIQQHPIIMTDSDKTVRVLCAFEAPEQTITLKNPSSRDNKTGIDVGAPETSRTRHDKQQYNSVVSNKAAPPSVILRILDSNGRDASMINLGDELTLKIHMQMDGQTSALGIFARNLAARSSNGESLLLIDNDGCPVDPQVFAALEVDPRDGKSLYSNFKAFRFPSSGLVNFEVQIRFCPERCQPVDCHRNQQHMRSYGKRRKRDLQQQQTIVRRTSIIQSMHPNQGPVVSLDSLSTVMKPGKAFEYVRKLLLNTEAPQTDQNTEPTNANVSHQENALKTPVQDDFASGTVNYPDSTGGPNEEFENHEQSTRFSSDHEQKSSSQQSSQSYIDTPPTATLAPGEPVKNEFNVINDGLSQTTTSSYIEPSSFESPTSLTNLESDKPDTTTGYTSSAPYGRPPISLDSHDNVENYLNKMSVHQPVDLYGSGGTDAPIQPSDNAEQNGPREQDNVSSPVEVNANQSSGDTNGSMMSGKDADHGSSRDQEQTNSQFQPPSVTADSKAAEKDVPLRFSILVGETQNPASATGWTPMSQPSVLIMNSTNMDMDHIVIPGKKGQFLEPNELDNSRFDNNLRAGNPNSNNQDVNYRPNKRNASYEQTFDALPSNSAEVKLSNLPNGQHNSAGESTSESAASHDCPSVDSGRSKLNAIIWTGTFVIVLNVCLVVISLALYFRRLHLKKDHTIVGSATLTDCDTTTTHSLRRGRWPSVILKSKNKLGTSLNTHEQFFCKLNSKTGERNPGFHWPNLSSSSSHSTISSLANPLPLSNVRIAQMHQMRAAYDDSQSTLRSGYNSTGHKTIIDVSPYDGDHHHTHAKYTPNIDDTHDSERF